MDLARGLETLLVVATVALWAMSTMRHVGVGGPRHQRVGLLPFLDLCLKLRVRGYDVVFTPQAELVHHESASRGRG